MLKLYLLISLCIFVFTANGFAQACGYGRGKFEVVGNKAKPITNFGVTFYAAEDFDLSGRKEITNGKKAGNGWSIYLTEKEAEKFIADRSPFNINLFISDKEKADSIIFYKDNFYNYRTRELYGNLFLVKISAKDYKNFYFISPALGGCEYYNLISLTSSRKR